MKRTAVSSRPLRRKSDRRNAAAAGEYVKIFRINRWIAKPRNRGGRRRPVPGRCRGNTTDAVCGRSSVLSFARAVSVAGPSARTVSPATARCPRKQVVKRLRQQHQDDSNRIRPKRFPAFTGWLTSRSFLNASGNKAGNLPKMISFSVR